MSMNARVHLTQDGKVRLHTLLGDYPGTRPLREGAIASGLVELDIAPITTAQKGFKPLVREAAFDLAEVAIMTFLVARDHGKPYALLPLAMNGKFHHGSLYYRTALGALAPKDLEGRRVGLRSYTQTTPTWVRGYLAEDYGVDLSKIHWVTFEDAHVAEFIDPSHCERAEPGTSVDALLLDGGIDVGMIGANAPEDDRIAPLIPDPDGAAAAWYARHRAVPINHMVCVHKDILAARPDAVREAYRMLLAARAMAGGPKIVKGIDTQPAGVEALRNALELAVRYAWDQGLIRKPLTVDDLFDETTALLGTETSPA